MMAILSRETASQVFAAHHDLEVGRKLLTDLDDVIRQERGPAPWDTHTTHKRYTLGVPSGHGERILDLSPRLARAIIEAHIADKERQLIEVSLRAKLELER